MTARILLLTMSAGATWAQISAPMLGWIPDGACIRPVYGIPAVAAIAAPIESGRDFAVIAISPRQDFALATDASTGELIIAPSGTRIDGAALFADRIVMSPRGSSAALLAGNRVQVVTGLPDAPSVRDLNLNGSPAAMAISDDGQWLAAAMQDGTYLFGSIAQKILDEPVIALTFFHQRASLALATSTRLVTFSDGALTDIGAAPDAATGVALSFDNRRIVVAGRSGALVAIDLSGGPSTTVDCGCSPEGVFGMGGAIFRLTSPASGAVKLFDAVEGQVLIAPPALDAGARQ